MALEDLNTFQRNVREWCVQCFGEDVTNDVVERTHRFFEEAAELCQALGMSRHDADTLLDYVYGRPAGEPKQEIGGTMVTLAALASAANIELDRAAVTELMRILGKVDEIRAKHAAKPRGSPLPGKAPAEAATADGGAYHLVLSFPDQSAPFAHGFEAGMLWQRLKAGEPLIEVTTRTENAEIVRRMAVAKGYDLSLKASEVEGWDYVRLTVGKAPPKTPNPHGLKAV